MAEQEKNLNQTPGEETTAVQPASSNKPAKAEKSEPNFFVRNGRKLSKWFRDLRSEAKKVVWPTGKQVVNNTVIVIVCIILVAVFVALLDVAFGFVRELILDLV